MPMIELEQDFLPVRDSDWTFYCYSAYAIPADADALVALGASDDLPGAGVFVAVSWQYGGLFVRPSPLYANLLATTFEDRWRRVLPFVRHCIAVRRLVERDAAADAEAGAAVTRDALVDWRPGSD